MKAQWDDFVGRSKQGTFLFCRDFMDYHRDRFADHSLMLSRDGKLCAMLPANERDGVLWSHGGLTYGGLLTTTDTRAVEVCEMFADVNAYLQQRDFHKVVYKPVPWIYHLAPAEEDRYAIANVCHARLVERNLASVIRQDDPVRWSYNKRYGANKAKKDGVVVEQDNTRLPDFWQILTDNLQTNHNATPVHSLEEIVRLQAAFPDNIRLYVAHKGHELLGGSLLFVCGQTVHSQYISASPLGKELHAVDAIFKKVITEDYASARYFDFGTSNEDHGRVLNHGLVAQKEHFGARGVCYDWYEWEV